MYFLIVRHEIEQVEIFVYLVMILNKKSALDDQIGIGQKQ